MWLLALVAAAYAASPEEAIVAAFTPRHVTATCDAIAVEHPKDRRVAAFVAVAEGVEVPPWVPVAAAGCVAELGREPVARAAVDRWIADPSRMGLAVAALGRLDALPADVAAPLALAAVARGDGDARFAAWARPLLDASRHDAVRASLRPAP